ncbi:MAG: aromatic amino acid ammonia-lyase, partial [Flavobacteriales bacterium]|nr:aromatic amino acid ammonia-lyase [Flavobacteriales bacterium]
MALSWCRKSAHDMDLNWWTLEDVWRKLQSEHVGELADDAKEAIEKCYGFLQETIANADEGAIYGVNTGFGDLAHTRVDNDSLQALQRNILVSHACGVGEDVPKLIVRAMLLLKIKSLSKGHSGVQLVTVERLLTHLNEGVLPVVPSQGSLGASGDLAPLSHLVLPLIGEGELVVDGVVVPSSTVLKAKGWDPIELGAKEGLALIRRFFPRVIEAP